MRRRAPAVGWLGLALRSGASPKRLDRPGPGTALTERVATTGLAPGAVA